MADFKNMTVRYLRDLARKHLGKGHSKLKTKEELFAALKKIVPGLDHDHKEASADVASQEGPRAVASRRETPTTAPAEVVRFEKGAPKPTVTVVAAPPEPGPEPTVEREPTGEPTAPAKPVAIPAAASARPSGADGRAPLHPVSTPAVTAPSRANGHPVLRAVGDEGVKAALPGPVSAPARNGVGRNGNGRRSWTGVAAEPVVEGFFVSRIAGEQEARSHHLTQAEHAVREASTGPKYDERLGEIPWEYRDDRVVLMARDPHTAYVYWDLNPATRAEAFSGLREPRAVLRLFDNGHEVRVIDVALESRSFYIHGVAPARHYRVELHAVGADGSSRRIGQPSNTVTFPSDDVSGDTTVRFMRVPFGVPLHKLRAAKFSGRVRVAKPTVAPEPLTITRYRWVPLPNSGSWQLQQWQERVARPEQLPPTPAPAEAPYPVGGASSFTLQSSWMPQSSFVQGGSFAPQSSWALQSSYALQSSFAMRSSYALQSSWVMGSSSGELAMQPFVIRGTGYLPHPDAMHASILLAATGSLDFSEATGEPGGGWGVDERTEPHPPRPAHPPAHAAPEPHRPQPPPPPAPRADLAPHLPRTDVDWDKVQRVVLEPTDEEGEG